MRLALTCVAAALIVGCAGPSPITSTAAPSASTWRDPNFIGPPFKKIFVIVLSAQSLRDQRGFENLMVSTLQGVGVQAVPGWQFVPTDRTPDQATIRAAVAKSGADATLLVRITPVATQTSIGYGTGGTVPIGSDMYVGWYEPGITTQSYQVATIYTTLFDVKTARPVFTFNPPDYSPGTIEQDAPRFANDVTRLLINNGLVGGP
jgi:hypothetical protein